MARSNISMLQTPFFQSKVKDKEKRGFCIFQGAVIINIRGQR